MHNPDFIYPNVNKIYQKIIKINKSFCSKLKMYIYLILILKVRKWFTMNIVVVALRYVIITGDQVILSREGI